MRKNKFWLILGLALMACFTAATSLVLAQTDSADAIAVRVVPNPNHYSISRWYESQGFQGSPQALLVDGYDAIRDGRTVYVNAANLSGKDIFTNIYLISYNQNSVAATVDILGQIVSHWKFNTNLDDTNAANPVYHCTISSVNCASDADCLASQQCATSTPAVGSCVLKEDKTCLVDTDCPTNFFCDSIKAKISRDIKRVGKIEELKEALFKYKSVNGNFPLLPAGTYLAGNSLSVWPSWAQVLLSGLGVNQNFFDPINRLGACPGYDKITCWNKDTKQFYSAPSNNVLVLPPDSYAMAYSTDTTGSNYNLCAVLESRDPSLNYKFYTNDPATSNCVTATGIFSTGRASNTAPQLVDKYLIGESGREFNGFIKVVDREKNPLTWNIAPTSLSGWSGGPVLKDTSNPEQKKVYATSAGAPDDYIITLTVSDGDKTLTTTTPIKITAPSPFIEADNAEYILDQTVPFNYSFSFFSNNLANPESAYAVTPVSGTTGFNILSLAGAPKKATLVGSNKYRVDYKGLISTSSKLFQDTNSIYKITVTGKYGANPSSKEFSIHIIVEPPVLGFNCLNTARTGRYYSCLLGSKIQDHHNITYTAYDSSQLLPDGLQLVGQNTPISSTTPPLVYLQGTSTQVISADPYISRLTVRATNEYGASSTKDFILKINNFCGDGTLQTPNTEGRGGIYNDGYEDCDGLKGVAATTSRDVNFQYGCVTEVNAQTPDPISSNNYCVFKSPINGGGYCGDGICQLVIPRFVNGTTTNVLTENISNCSEDCQERVKCTPNCINKFCGSDGCGGNCGTCLDGYSCDPTFTCQKFDRRIPDCFNKECGSDGIGGSCGICSGYKTCNGYGQCSDPPCNNNGKPEPGETCATCSDIVCASNQVCDRSALKCVDRYACSSSCGKKICDSTNSCRQSCGSCAPGTICAADKESCCKRCILGDGSPNQCGLDSCGGSSCGNCALNAPFNTMICVRQHFTDPESSPRVKCCLPSNCINDGTNGSIVGSTRECGGNSCGGICGIGVCYPGMICNNKKGICEEIPAVCNKNGQCDNDEDCSNCPSDCACAAEYACNKTILVPACQKVCSCQGRACGDDGCGGKCGPLNGLCPAGQTCQSNQCISGGTCNHYVKCALKECGPDGCDHGETCEPGCATGQKCNSDGKCIKDITTTPDSGGAL